MRSAFFLAATQALTRALLTLCTFEDYSPKNFEILRDDLLHYLEYAKVCIDKYLIDEYGKNPH